MQTVPRANIEAVQRDIDRRANGHYTMKEAAEVIAITQGIDARKFLNKRMCEAYKNGELNLIDPTDYGPVKGRPCDITQDWVTPANMDKWLESGGFPYRWPVGSISSTVPTDSDVKQKGSRGQGKDGGDERKAAEPTQAATARGELLALSGNRSQMRAKVLEWFREEGGKRKHEGGRAGTWGALQRVVEKSGIDKDTLGKMLDKAIEEKRGADAFAQLSAKR